MKKINFIWAAVLFSLLTSTTKSIGQPIAPATDGTGTRVNPDGNRFDITGGQRSQDGANLFHSFETFGLDAGQIANFQSLPEIQNILGRVTGGDASIINGLIQVTGGNSNLFLMNPAGIVFGPNATLNVVGDFTATTATGIGFGDRWFNAIGGNDWANLVGTPSQFAFSLTQPGAIANFGNLALQPGHDLTLLGGSVLNAGTLSSPGGNITIAAVPGESIVRISQDNHLLSLEVANRGAGIGDWASGIEIPNPRSLPELLTGGGVSHASTVQVNPDGTVTLAGSGIEVPTQGTTIASGAIDVSSPNLPHPESPELLNGGQFTVLGDRVALFNAQIDASGVNGGGTVLIGGDFQGNGSIPNATHTFIDPNTTIDVNAGDLGDGGRVIVWADEATRFYGNINARGGASSGNGGFVEVSGKQFLTFNGQVDASAPNGNLGTLLLDPSTLTIIDANTGTQDGNLPNIEIDAPDSGENTVSWGQIVAQGATTDIVLQADESIAIADITGVVSSEPDVVKLPLTTGSLTLTAPQISFNDPNDTIQTQGGNLTFQIGQSMQGEANLGNLTTNGGNITIDGGNFVNTISTGNLNTSSTSDAGTITLNSPNGGSITTGTLNATSGSGNGGAVLLTTGTNGSIITGTIDTHSNSGSGGNITFESGNVSLTSSTIINAGTGTIAVESALQIGSNDLALIGNEIELGSSVSGTGNLILQPFTPSQAIAIGGSRPTDNLDLSLAEIEGLQDGLSSITIGRSDGSGAITLAGDVTFRDPVTIQAPGGGGSISGTGAIAGIDNATIALNANQSIATGSITNPGRAIAITSSGGAIDTSAGTLNTSTDGEDGGAIALSASTGITTGAIDASSVDGNAGSVTFDTSGAIALTDNINVSSTNGSGSAIAFPTEVILGEDVAIATTGGTGSGSITFNNTVDATTPDSEKLTLNAGTGNVTFTGEVGSTTGLGALVVNTSGTTEFSNSVNTQTLTTDADGTTAIAGNIAGQKLNFNDPVQIAGSDVELSGTTSVIFADTVDGNTSEANLTVNSPNTTFKGEIGSITPLDTLSTNGATAIESNATAAILDFNSTVSIPNGAALTADEINLGEIVSGTGDLVLQPKTEGQTISVGVEASGDGTSAGLDLTTAEMDRLQTGFNTIEIITSGTLNVNHFNVANPLVVFGGSISLGGNITATENASINLSGNIRLTDNTSITTNSQNITFGGKVTGNNYNLTTNTGGGNAIVKGDISVGELIFNNNVTLNGNTTFTASEIDFGGTVIGEGYNLILQPANASQAIALGSSDATNALDLSSTDLANLEEGFASITIGRSDGTGTIATDPQGIAFQDPVILRSPQGILTVNGSISLTDNASLSVNSDRTNLNENLTSEGQNIAIAGQVELGTEVTVSTGSGDGNISFANTIDGDRPLTLTAGMGSVQLNGSVGDSNPLASLTVNASNATVAGNITTNNGNITFNAPTTLTGSSTLNAGTAAIAFNNTVAAGNNLLTLTADEIDLSGGNNSVSGSRLILQPATPSLSINIATDTETPGLDLTVGEIAALRNGFNSIIVGSDRGSGTITMDTVKLYDPIQLRSPQGQGSLDIIGAVTLLDNATLTRDIANVTTILQGITTNGTDIILDEDIILGNDVTFSTGATLPGDIIFGGTLDGSRNLTLISGTGKIRFEEPVGLFEPLTNLTIAQAAQVEIVGGIRTDNTNLTLNSPITLLSDASFNSGTAVLTFNNTIDAANHLLILAGDEIDVNNPVTGSGLLEILPFSSAQNIAVGGTNNNTAALDLTQLELDRLTGFGEIAIGQLGGSGTIDLAAPLIVSQPTTLQSGLGTVNVNQPITAIGDASIAVAGNQTRLSANITTTGGNIVIGSETPGSQVQLLNDLAIASGGGNITFKGTVEGSRSLFLTAGSGQVQFDRPVGETTPLANLNLNSSATSVNGGIYTNNSNLTFDMPVTLTGNSTFDPGNANLTFKGSINAGEFDLTAIADEIDFGQPVSGTGNLVLQPQTASQGIAIGGNGSTANLDLTTAEMAKLRTDFNSVTIGRSDGSGTITISNVNLNAPTTVRSPLGSIAVSGNINSRGGLNLESPNLTLNGNIRSNSGDINLRGNSQLSANVNISTEGNIAIAGIVDGRHQLNLNAGSGNVELGGAVGQTTPLTQLSVSAAETEVTGEIATDNGDIQLNSAVTITGNGGTFNAGTGTVAIGSDLTSQFQDVRLIGNEIDLGGAVSGGGNLILQPGDANYNIAIGGFGSTANLDLTATEIANLQDGFRSVTIGRSDGSGAVTIGNITLFDPTIVQVPIAPGAIAVTGETTLQGNGSLTLIAPQTNLGGNISSERGNIAIASDVIQLNNDVTLSALDTGEITLAGVVDGAHHLAIDAGGDVRLNRSLGETTPLTGLTVQSRALALNGDITTDDGDVTINAPIALQRDTFLKTGMGDVTVNGTIDGDYQLIINGGNVSVSEAIGGIKPLASLAIDALGSINLQDVTTNGDVDLSAMGEIITGNIITNSGKIDLFSAEAAIATDILDTSAQGSGGKISVDAAGDVTTANITSSSDTIDAGDISVTSRTGSIATQDIAAESLGTADSSNSDNSDRGGGNITLRAALNIITGNISSRSIAGEAGKIDIRANGQITTGNINGSGFLNAADVIIASLEESIKTGDIIASSAQGAGGRISLSAPGNIITGDIEATGLTEPGVISAIGTESGNIQTGDVTSFSATGDRGVVNISTNGGKRTGRVTLEPRTESDGTIAPPEPIPSSQPEAAQPSEDAVEPAVTEEPTVSEEPAVTEEPTAPEEPTASEQPAVPQSSPQPSNPPQPAIAGGQGSPFPADNPLQGVGENPPIAEPEPSDDAIADLPDPIVQMRENNNSERPTVRSSLLNTPSIETLNPDNSAPTTQVLNIPRFNVTNHLTSGDLTEAVGGIEELRGQEFAEYFGNEVKEEPLNAQSIRDTLSRITRQTGTKPAIVYTMVLPDRLEIVMITAEGTPIRKSVPAANRATLMRTVSAFRSELTNPRGRFSNTYLAIARQLYQWTIAPIESELAANGIDTLLFSMDSGLRTLPIAALHDGQQFLVEKYSLALIPSISLTDTRYQSIQNSPVLAMGASIFQNLTPLPAVPVELFTITQKVWKGTALLNAEFTRSNLLLQRQKYPYEIVHLATHGEFTEGELNSSYIQLWDEKLQLDELRTLGWNNPQVELLVLSACRTAVGDEKAELGFAGFAVQAGVKSALASLWYVSDEGTLGLMTEFYQHLATAPIKAEALRQAQIAMIRGQVKIEGGQLRGTGELRGVSLPPELAALDNHNLSHPYYWAAFTMIGSPW